MHDHLNIAKTITNMILENWEDKDIESKVAEYLAFVYREKEQKSNSWNGVVDKQSGAFTQEEIDHKGWI
jgi:hypothetical protein